MPPALSAHPRLRLLAFGALYAAQGIPEGLMYVAAPAWLAQRGVSASAIGAMIGVILIPWSLKLINGAVMDRWSFLAMGRRRPWVLFAQTGLVTTLIGMSLIADPVSDLALVTAFGVALNAFGAFQDVAVDGMAIDILPPEDLARANGIMWGSKTLGIAGASAAGAWLLDGYGWAAASLGIAAVVAAIMLFPLLLRERPGERLFPWSAGQAAPESAARQLGRWGPILGHLLRVAKAPSSYGLIAAIFTALAAYGLFISLAPVMAVQALGWRDTDFSHMAATMNLVGGLFGILAAGPLANRFGMARTLVASLLLLALLHGTMALLPQEADSRTVFTLYVAGHQILFVQMSVAIYALAMRLSDPAIAATQFALFMAFVNLGTSAGAVLLGPIRDAAGFTGVFGAMAAIAACGALLFARLRTAASPQ